MNIKRPSLSIRALLLVVAICSSAMLGTAPAAHAESSGDGLTLQLNARTNPGLTHDFYFLVKPGEQVKADFTVTSSWGTEAYGTVDLIGENYTMPTKHIDTTSPVGTVVSVAGPVATKESIWKLTVTNGSGATSGGLLVTWNMGAYLANTFLPGRVWTYGYRPVNLQSVTAGSEDLPLYYMTKEGYVYKGLYRELNGAHAAFSSNAYGLIKTGTCTSVYESSFNATFDIESANKGRPSYAEDLSCGSINKIFFDNPLTANLPASAVDNKGTSDWLYTPPQPTTISNLSYTHTAKSPTMQGTIAATIQHYSGNFMVDIDVNHDGDFTDPEDRHIQSSTNGGTVSVPFDGKDGTGKDIPAGSLLSFRVTADKKGEIHFIRNDIELSRGGLEVTRLNGSSAQRTQLYWNDANLSTPRCGTRSIVPMNNSTTGVDSTGGVHAWDVDGCITKDGLPSGGQAGNDYTIDQYVAASSWGDNRLIDDWTYDNGSAATSTTITTAAPKYTITKTVDKAQAKRGDTLTYTLTVRNDGDAGVPTVVDILPAGLTYDTAKLPNGCTVDGQKLSCRLTTSIEKGTDYVLPLVVTVTGTTADTLTNTAHVYGLNDSECTSDTATATRCSGSATVALETVLAETGQSYTIWAIGTMVMIGGSGAVLRKRYNRIS